MTLKNLGLTKRTNKYYYHLYYVFPWGQGSLVGKMAEMNREPQKNWGELQQRDFWFLNRSEHDSV